MFEKNIDLLSNLSNDIETLKLKLNEYFDDKAISENYLLNRKKNKFQRYLNSKLFDLRKLEYENFLKKVETIKSELIPKITKHKIAVILNFRHKDNLQKDDFCKNMEEKYRGEGSEVFSYELIHEKCAQNILQINKIVNKIINNLPNRTSPNEQRVICVKAIGFEEDFKKFLNKILENDFEDVNLF